MRVFGLKQTALVLSALGSIVLSGCGGVAPDKKQARPGAESSPRGIVLVTVDGWWDPATKSDSIPADFAASALRLSDAMTPCPQIRPAVCSMLTGKSPIDTGVRDDVTTPLPVTVSLVPQQLTERGWRTAAFVADPRVGHGSGLERGFEVFAPPKEFLLGSFRRLPTVRNPDEVVSDFATWMPSLPDDASFFAWIHLSRPMIDPPEAGGPEDVSTALERLSRLINGSARLKRAAVMLAGTAGQVDLDDGGNSGYFLNPDVLRVPVLVRSGTSDGGAPDARSTFSLLDVAGWIAREAGIDAALYGVRDAKAPRVAWTWRGYKEFGWPAEAAAQKGSAFCVVDIPRSADRCVSWERQRPIDDADCSACIATLDQETRLGEPSAVIPTLPVDLTQGLSTLGLRPPSARADAGPPVAREIRERVVPSITRARRFANSRKAADADVEYRKALAIDPKNSAR